LVLRKERTIMANQIVISLYDFTGEALKPWAEAGYTCYAYDIQHPVEGRNEGGIRYRNADLHDADTMRKLTDKFKGLDVVFGMAFPVCTDMAVSGAAHFATKGAKDPGFQDRAAQYAVWCSDMFEELEVSYMVENPVSVLASKWRKPDYRFHPYEYGGYIPDAEAQHPRWPEYIADRDAYPKKTCLWVGGGFILPEKDQVQVDGGYATQYHKLGGKSQRTKDIRSATPRGFAKAIFSANKPTDKG
jgi:hypothetical protein